MSQIEGSNSSDELSEITIEPNETAKTLAKLQHRSRFTLFIAWIALFFTVVGIATGYKNWMTINDRAKQATIGVADLKQQTDLFAKKTTVIAFNQQLLDDLDNKSTQLGQSVQLLETVKNTTQHAAETVEQQVALLTQQQEKQQASSTTPNTTWRLAELRFLLQIANQRLHLNHDKNGALQALRTAETTLLKLGSSQYLAVRKKLAEEIVALESLLIPNISAISQRIADLIEVIKVMPVKTDIVKQQNITLLPKVSSEQNELLSRFITEINQAVVIRKFDESVQKTMGIDEKEKLKNLLQLRFETLRLMVLQRLDYDYHQQLNLIKQTLEKYYPEMINGTLKQQLSELNTVKLSPLLPNISGSLTLLKQVSRKKNKE